MLHKDSSKSKPSWTASSNFPALLNLSSQIKKFGPPRSIWEGGEPGEGVVKQLKPLVRVFASNNWDVDLLNNFYSRRSIKNLCDDYGCAHLRAVTTHAVKCLRLTLKTILRC